MIIDDHNHAGYGQYSAERMVENMDACGIDRAWLLSWECPMDELNPEQQNSFAAQPSTGPIPFECGLACWKKYPDRFILGYAPDPRRPGAIERLKHAVELYDVRVCGEIKLRMMLDNPDALRMYRFCGERGLPVLVHIDYEFESAASYPRPSYWYGGGIDAFERAIRACPETNFIGHAPGFWAHISDDGKYRTMARPSGKVVGEGDVIRMLRQYPNLYCDISAGSGHNALSRDTEFARAFLIEFSDRILYGRDFLRNIHRELLESLALPQEVKDNIYYKNALRLTHMEA